MSEDANPILEFLAHFDRLQLEVLAVHITIHQRLFEILAARLGCARDDLPSLKFMHAVRLAFAGRNYGSIVELLQKLDSARNILAHKDDPAKFNAKFAELAMDVLGPNYDPNPSSLEARVRQDNSALQYVKAVVETARVA